jgi:DNA-binding response OmpR family regulator
VNSNAILIVDDEELIRESLRLDLCDLGYTVEAVATGAEALQLLGRGFDLLITDLIMEGMNGLEVLRRAKEADPTLAVFILTGHREVEAAIGALRLGADDYLIKPYEHAEMVERVQSCLQQRRQEETAEPENLAMLSICSDCKKIRTTPSKSTCEHQWIRIEQFLSQTLGTELSHGICPDCYQKKIAELNDIIRGGRSLPRP